MTKFLCIKPDSGKVIARGFSDLSVGCTVFQGGEPIIIREVLQNAGVVVGDYGEVFDWFELDIAPKIGVL